MGRRPFDPIEFDQRQGRRDREHWWRTKGAWWIVAGLWIAGALILELLTCVGCYTPKEYGMNAHQNRYDQRKDQR